ncbi:MAG: hypothetical protein AB1486_10425 [Planctomycetota bacterium]
MRRRTVPALAVTFALLAGCSYMPPRYQDFLGLRPAPNHLVTLELEPPRLAVSTEDGIICLVEDALRTDDIPFTFQYGRGIYADFATVDRINETLGILLPQTTQVPQARFATYPPTEDDDLVIGTRDEGGRAAVEAVRLYEEGRLGDLIALDMELSSAHAFIERHTGAGVYVWRDDHYQLVGLLNGAYLLDRPVAAFVGLHELARILPIGSDFFAHQPKVPREDFEYGLPYPAVDEIRGRPEPKSEGE